jgi:hypothetical protein
MCPLRDLVPAVEADHALARANEVFPTSRVIDDTAGRRLELIHNL